MQPDLDLIHNLAVAGKSARAGGVSADAGPRWFRISNQDDSVIEVLLYGEIGDYGVTAADFAAEIGAIRSETINLRINSGGGDVFDGLAIFESLKRHPARIRTFVDGVAASAASFIAMAGDEIVMGRHSRMMIHEAMSGGVVLAGNAEQIKAGIEDAKRLVNLLDSVSDTIANVYADRGSGSRNHYRTMMKRETWLTADQAVSEGLADRVDGDPKGPWKPGRETESDKGSCRDGQHNSLESQPAAWNSKEFLSTMMGVMS